MKKILLLTKTMLLTLSLSAQYVFVNSPAEIQGPLAFNNGYATDPQWAIDLNTGIWTADGVLVQDGTVNPSQGCEALVNGAEVTGKIALIDRGTCSFTQKLCHAQDAGAIAVVIMNSAVNAGLGPGPLGFTAGICVPTIPIVHISYEDGLLIKAALANGPVNISIGNLQFANNVGSSARTGIFHAPMGVVPASQIEEIYITSGAQVTNLGNDAATNVTVEAAILFTPEGGSASEVFSGSASVPLIEPDSSAVIVVDDYLLTDEIGYYQMTYNIYADAVDEIPNDNAFDTDFYVSENVFCKGGWDVANNRPKTTNAYTISGGGNIEFLAPFRFPNGAGLRADSMKFYVSSNANLQGADLSVYLYKWEDLNGDATSTNDEISIVGLQTVAIADSVTNAWVTTEIVNFATFETGYEISDGEILMAGVRYKGSNSTFFGFDEDMDYTQFLNYQTAQGITINDADLPYIGVNAFQGTPEMADITNGFLFGGVRGAVATALILSETTISTANTDHQVGLDVFPNPASSEITAEILLEQAAREVEYRILDAQGRLLKTLQKEDITTDRVVFDVSDLTAGSYFFVVKSDKGTRSKAFTVQR